MERILNEGEIEDGQKAGSDLGWLCLDVLFLIGRNLLRCANGKRCF